MQFQAKTAPLSYIGGLLLHTINDEKVNRARLRVQTAIEDSLDRDLPDAYDKVSFKSKIGLLMNHFIDMAVQGYGWVAA